jgi:hypothetical protein
VDLLVKISHLTSKYKKEFSKLKPNKKRLRRNKNVKDWKLKLLRLRD